MTDHVQSKAYNSWMAIDIAKDFNVVMVETVDGNTKRFRMAGALPFRVETDLRGMV